MFLIQVVLLFNFFAVTCGSKFKQMKILGICILILSVEITHILTTSISR